MGRKYIWIALALAVCSAAPSFATLTTITNGIEFQFDELGNSNLTKFVSSVGSTVAGVTATQTGAFDSLGGSTLMYTLPTGYTFALASGVNQYAVLIKDSSNQVSDLVIFQNSGGKGQVIVFDSPAAALAEAGNGDLAKAYLIPQQGGQAYGDPAYPDVNYPSPKTHPAYLNSPAYMTLALGIYGSTFATSIALEGVVDPGGPLSPGEGIELIGGKSTINGTSTFDFFISSSPSSQENGATAASPEPVTAGLGLVGLAGVALAAARRRRGA